MISPCLYTHPDPERVKGLARHDAARLFPYNPDFYGLASGLYGPGSYYCWHFLIVSVLANWVFAPRDADGVRRRRISADLLAMVTSSVFAATDVVVQSVSLWGMPGRALAVFCLRFPAADLSVWGQARDAQFDFSSVPPEVLNVGQRAVSITGPLTICYTYSTVCLILILSFVDAFGLVTPTLWTKRLLYAAYAYLCLAITICQITLGDFLVAVFMGLYEGMMPLAFVVFFGLLALGIMGYLGAFGILISALVHRRFTTALWVLKVMGFGLLPAAMLAVLVLEIFDNEFSLVPDLGIGLAERDQLAALLVGIASLAFTLHHFWIRWKASKAPSYWELWEEVKDAASRV